MYELTLLDELSKTKLKKEVEELIADIKQFNFLIESSNKIVNKKAKWH